MEENNQNPAPAELDPPAPAAEQTFTQEDIDKALAAAKEEWKQGLKAQIENAKSEGEKLAKMTAAEREAEEKRLEYEKFQKEKAEFERERMATEVKAQLADKGLPTVFAEMIAADTAEASKANIEAFHTAWNTALEAAVKTKLGGKTPNLGEVKSVETATDFFGVIKSNQRI